jgi:hypothetical protein
MDRAALARLSREESIELVLRPQEPAGGAIRSRPLLEPLTDWAG